MPNFTNNAELSSKIQEAVDEKFLLILNKFNDFQSNMIKLQEENINLHDQSFETLSNAIEKICKNFF